MSSTPETTRDYNLYYILAVVAFALTGFIITGSILHSVLYGIIGLLFAAFFVNVLVKDRE